MFAPRVPAAPTFPVLTICQAFNMPDACWRPRVPRQSASRENQTSHVYYWVYFPASQKVIRLKFMVSCWSPSTWLGWEYRGLKFSKSMYRRCLWSDQSLVAAWRVFLVDSTVCVPHRQHGTQHLPPGLKSFILETQDVWREVKDPAGKFPQLRNCLSHCSVAKKRHHDRGSSYRRKHLTRDLLAVSEG